MYQDERGFIWIGTRNGANLYNGHEFKYTNSKTTEQSDYNNISIGDKSYGNGEIYFMHLKRSICF